MTHMSDRPRFKQVDIDNLFTMYDELEDIQRKLTAAVRGAQDSNGGKDITIEREGKHVTVKENDLWQEVFVLGMDNCDAGKVLGEKYPRVKELKEAEGKKVIEVKEREIKTFGFDHKQLSLPNIIRLLQGLIRIEQSENGGEAEAEVEDILPADKG